MSNKRDTRSVRPEESLFDHLADENGSIDMNVDGSGTPVHFDWVCPNDRQVDLVRLNVTMLASNFEPVNFGSATALTTGIRIAILNAAGEETLHFTRGLLIKDNTDWGGLSGVDSGVIDIAAGNNPDSKIIRWTIEKAGHPLELWPGERIRLTVADDCSDPVLLKFRGKLQGDFHIPEPASR